MTTDFNVINMHSMMSVKVTMPDPANPERWIRDPTWYEQIRETYRSFANFLNKNNLLNSPADASDIDKLVIKFSDLTETGKAFVQTGATDRWLGSLDRPSRPVQPSNVKSMQRALDRMDREKARN